MNSGLCLYDTPFVAEVLAELVDLLQTADDQPLEIELGRDPQVQGPVELVVVSGERPRERAAVERLKHRGLDLHEPAVVEVSCVPRRQRSFAARTAPALRGWRSGRARGDGNAARRRRGRGTSPAAGATTWRAASSHRLAARARRAWSGRGLPRRRSDRRGRGRRAARRAPRRARPGARAAGSCPSGPPGRGTRPCRDLAAPRGGRRGGSSRRLLSRPSGRRSARRTMLDRASARESCAGNGSMPAARSRSSLRRRSARSSGSSGWLGAPRSRLRGMLPRSLALRLRRALRRPRLASRPFASSSSVLFAGARNPCSVCGA